MLPCIENINKQKTNSFDRKDDLIVLQSGRAEWKGCRSTIMQSLQPTCSPWPPQWLQKFEHSFIGITLTNETLPLQPRTLAAKDFSSGLVDEKQRDELDLSRLKGV